MSTPGRTFHVAVAHLIAIMLIVASGCGSLTPDRRTPTAVTTVPVEAIAPLPPPTPTPTRTPTIARTTWDVREFGARPDDEIDDTDAIQDAIAAAARAPESATVYIPAGQYLIRASNAHAFDGILVKSGVSLVGAGSEQTILKLMPETVQPGWRSIRLMLVEGETRVADLALDGSRSEIDRAAVTDISTILLRTRPGAADVVWERLSLHDAYADIQEGFALSVSQASHVIVRDIDASDNDGSGVTVGGNIYGIMSRDVTLSGIRVARNDWQGLTFFGAASTIASDIVAFDNGLSGINIEWSNAITIRDAISYGNGRRGFNTYGVSTNIRVERLRSQGNGVGNRDGAEIGMEAWHWQGPDPESGITEIGIVQNIGFYDCRIRPARGYPHVLVNPDAEHSTTVATVPHTIILASPGVQRWIFSYDGFRVRGDQLRKFSEDTYGVPLITDDAQLVVQTTP